MANDDPEVTEVSRLRRVEQINGQPVHADIVTIATQEGDEEVDTAVVAFFDVDYIRSAEDHNDTAVKIRDRTIGRNEKQSSRFIR